VLTTYFRSRCSFCWLYVKQHQTSSLQSMMNRQLQRQAYVQVDCSWRRRYCRAWSSFNHIFCIKPFFNNNWQQTLQVSTGGRPDLVGDSLPSRTAHIQGWFTLLSRRST
jgi:hypothetical protein